MKAVAKGTVSRATVWQVVVVWEEGPVEGIGVGFR